MCCSRCGLGREGWAGVEAGGWERAVETAPRGACGRHEVRLRGLGSGERVPVGGGCPNKK